MPIGGQWVMGGLSQMISLLMLAAVIFQPGTISGTDARKHVGKTMTVCGPVATTRYDPATAGGPTFLNLDRPFPDQSLTVVVYAADRAQFGEPETRYRGKSICATGVIEELTQPAGVLRIVAKTASQIREKPAK
jgi:hypothetical protein